MRYLKPFTIAVAGVVAMTALDRELPQARFRMRAPSGSAAPSR